MALLSICVNWIIPYEKYLSVHLQQYHVVAALLLAVDHEGHEEGAGLGEDIESREIEVVAIRVRFDVCNYASALLLCLLFRAADRCPKKCLTNAYSYVSVARL